MCKTVLFSLTVMVLAACTPAHSAKASSDKTHSADASINNTAAGTPIEIGRSFTITSEVLGMARR